MPDVAIRPATLADAERIARLVTELGYATAPDQMDARLDAILRDDDYETLVACDDGTVVGFLGLRCGLLYAYMVWVWRFVFSVAVGMAMLGFLALVLHRGVWLVALLYLIAIMAAIIYYLLFRPELGVD